MIAGQSSCAIHSGSLVDLGASGERRSPSRTSRTVRREHPSARAISRSPRPSASRRRISSYRCTVMLRSAMLPSPSWWPTKGAAGAARIAATNAQGAENAAWMAAGGKSAAQQARRAAIGRHPWSRVPPKTTQTRHISTSADHSHARARRPERLRRWSPTEEIGWSRTQEIRWYPSQEIGWVRSEEILHQTRHALAPDAHAVDFTKLRVHSTRTVGAMRALIHGVHQRGELDVLVLMSRHRP